MTTQTFLTNLGIALLAFVTSAILARWLGRSGRGQLAAIVLWPTLLTYLATFGLLDAIVYFAALPSTRLERLVGSVLARASGTIDRNREGQSFRRWSRTARRWS